MPFLKLKSPHEPIQPQDYNRNPIKNPQHPWLGGDNLDKIWWQTASEDESGLGYDATFLFILKIKGSKVKVVYAHPERLPLEDARIYRDTPFRYIITGNQRLKLPKERKIKSGDCPALGCVVITQCFAYIDVPDYNRLTLEMGKCDPGLCLNISEPIEKNWSYWKFFPPNGISLRVISYKITPYHKAYTYTNDFKDGCFEVSQSSSSNILDNVERHYDRQLLISLGTPAYDIGSGNFVGVGHMKIKINKFEEVIKSHPNDPISKWYNWDFGGNKGEDMFWHPYFVYFAYFYIFHPTVKNNNLDISITHISPAFMVEGFQPYPLCFPAGLAYNEGTKELIFSYGESDFRSKLYKLTAEQLKTICRPVDTYIQNGTLVYPFGLLKLTGDIFIPV